MSAAIRRRHPRDHLQQRGLAGAVVADEAHGRAKWDCCGHILERIESVAGPPLRKQGSKDPSERAGRHLPHAGSTHTQSIRFRDSSDEDGIHLDHIREVALGGPEV
jgi:hypothetical protein